MTHRNPLHHLGDDDIQASESGQLWLNQVQTLLLEIKVIDFTFNPPNLVAGTETEHTATITGLSTVDDIITVIKPTKTTGYVIAGSHYVSAANTLKIQVFNPTGSDANPGSETWRLVYLKQCRN